MIYLNTTKEGGSTYFPDLEINVEPLAGTALAWNNIGPDGQLNSSTLHTGMPVKAGFKAVITKWFRSVDARPHYNKEANELLTPLTRSGFLKKSLPEQLYQQIRSFYQKKREQSIPERIPDYISNTFGEQPSVLIELTDELRQTVHQTLQPMVEAWIGDYLQPTYVFGIREYRNGAILKEHRDRINTHVASVIINVDQEVNSDWPLVTRE